MPAEQRVCACCGLEFELLGSQTSEQIDWRVRITRVVHRRLRYRRRCECPGQRTMIAPRAPNPIPQGRFTPSFLARLLHEKYVLGLPVHRIVRANPLWCWAHYRRYFIRTGDSHAQLRIWRDQWVTRIAELYLAHRAMATAALGSAAHTQARQAFDQVSYPPHTSAHGLPRLWERGAVPAGGPRLSGEASYEELAADSTGNKGSRR